MVEEAPRATKHTRGRQRFPDDNQHSSFDDAEEWETVANMSHYEDDGHDLQGRRLLKCLQLDLSSFGLEKAGLAHQFAGLLTSEEITLLYSSTFRYDHFMCCRTWLIGL